MKRETAKWVRKAEQDWEVAHQLAGDTPPPRTGLVVPRTHDLADILELLLLGNITRARLRRQADSLTQYAVEYRYPGMMASKRQMEAALRHADQIRLERRGKLHLSLS